MGSTVTLPHWSSGVRAHFKPGHRAGLVGGGRNEDHGGVACFFDGRADGIAVSVLQGNIQQHAVVAAFLKQPQSFPLAAGVRGRVALGVEKADQNTRKLLVVLNQQNLGHPITS